MSERRKSGTVDGNLGRTSDGTNEPMYAEYRAQQEVNKKCLREISTEEINDKYAMLLRNPAYQNQLYLIEQSDRTYMQPPYVDYAAQPGVTKAVRELFEVLEEGLEDKYQGKLVKVGSYRDTTKLGE